ncbi:MAG: hypothetical protein NT149_02525 [Candidatus Gottesmanbacteria bacterium]|nr:hypothetical protein [Candidatus Gottesmanbacteria bacterium]
MPTFSLSDPLFWLQFLYYFIAVFIAYYIPGSLFLRQVTIPRIFKISLSVTLGMVLFACQGYLFGYLHMRYGTYIYLLACFLIWLLGQRKKKALTPSTQFKLNWKTWAIILTGSLMQLSTIWFTGVTLKGNAYYCCGNANDNFLYGSLSREVIRAIPPENPGMTGELFKNYHYWSNIIIGETSRIFGLPVFQTQFQYSTVLVSLLTGILLISLIWSLGGSKNLASWTVFFFYFGSDAIYWLIAFTRSAPIFSMSSLEDGAGFLANYPRAMAVMVGVAAMILLFYVRKKPTLTLVIATSLLFASITGMKIYVAFFMYVGLLSIALFDAMKHKSKTAAIIGFMTVAIVLPIYVLTNTGAGGLYYLGFWRAQNFIVQPWLNLLRLEQARIIYEADHKWVQVMCFNILFTAIYIVATFGTKTIALLNTKKTLKQLPLEVHIFLLPAFVTSFLLGFLFNQDTGESNTFNFLVSVFIFSSLYAALVINYAVEKRSRYIGIIVAVIIILMTIPRPIYRTYRNISDLINKRSFSISKNILSAATAVRNGTNLTDVFLITPRYFKFDTQGPVFSMLLDRPMYFSGEQFLYWFKAPPGEVARRKYVVSTIFTSNNIIEVAAELKQNQINYIFDVPSSLIGGTTSASFIQTFYQNYDTRVLKIVTTNIPKSVFDDFIESTQASVMRFDELAAPYR